MMFSFYNKNSSRLTFLLVNTKTKKMLKQVDVSSRFLPTSGDVNIPVTSIKEVIFQFERQGYTMDNI